MPNEKQRGLKKQGRENCQSESVLARPARASVGPPLARLGWMDPAQEKRKGKITQLIACSPHYREKQNDWPIESSFFFCF